MYYAIIGDIIQSKELANRMEIQTKLNSILHEINKKYADEIAANFIITLGDEFQGLLNSPENLIDIIDLIKFYLHPIKVRFGIGIGEINTEINREMAIGADGPAYYFAREKIEEIKMQKKSKMSSTADVKLKAYSNETAVDLINSNFCLCQFVEDKWTDKQRELIKEMLFAKKSQREVGEKLGVVQSSIQRRLKSSGYYDYVYCRETIKKSIINIWGSCNGE